MSEILNFNQLGSAAQEKFIEHARLLLEKKYVTNVDVNVLAEKCYESYMKERIDNQSETVTAPAPKKSFLAYEKDSVLNIPDLKKEDNWLK